MENEGRAGTWYGCPPWWRPFVVPQDYLLESGTTGTLMRYIPQYWWDALDAWSKVNPGGNPWNWLLAQTGFDDMSRAILQAGASQHDVWHKLAKIRAGVGSLRRDFMDEIRKGRGTTRDWTHLYAYWDRPKGHAFIAAIPPSGPEEQRDMFWREYRKRKARQGQKGRDGRKAGDQPIPPLALYLSNNWLFATPPISVAVVPLGFAFMTDGAIASTLDAWVPRGGGKVWEENTVKSTIRQLGLKRVQSVVSKVFVNGPNWHFVARDGYEFKVRPATDTGLKA